MAKFLLEIAKIVGTSTQNSGSWVHAFSPSQAEKISQRGQLLAVIGIANPPEEVEIATAGREIISRLHEEYFGDLIASPLEQLKKAVEKIGLETTGEVEIDVGAIAVVGNVLYGAVNNGARLVLARKGKVATILVGKETISGYLEDGDLFCLGTGEFFQLVPQGVLQAALTTNSPSEAAESIAPVVHGQEDGGKAAAVIFKVKKQEFKETELPEIKKQDRELNRIFQVGKTIAAKVKEKTLEKITSLAESQKKTPRSQKTVITVALILLLILGVSVVLGARQRRHPGLTQKTSVLLEQAQEKLKEGKDLLTLNPTKASQLLLEAQDLTQQIESAGLKTEEFLKFQEELRQTLGKVLKEHQVEGAVFFDLELIKANAKGDNLTVLADQLVILDEVQSTIYGLGIKDKKSTILASGEKLRGIRLIAMLGDKIYALTEEGILETELRIKKDASWGEIVDMAGFGTSLYLLDKKGEIWKYPIAENGFGTKQKWLKGEAADFSQVVSVAIDGAIWVLGNDGKIWKFIQGTEENFRVTGLAKSLLNPSIIYTDSEQSSLYVLDKGNSRIVVLKKTGEYDSEYVWPASPSQGGQGIKDAVGLVVSEKEKKIFLLGGSKIYTLELKI
ncbi:hypothetical protein CO054_03230 [Candidatus Shapirobacteria bacterium CG_4_9_14_0_2_um_filter_39_11]|uniref:PPM-type phosphatase domain-containing protein n=1 Tax=Candidatus Shapirobacteria bacterium CG_4_9_14_0_2_um_filter_39_11 TaxID=1974478 RepID=A0A2M8ERX2_9BACT|nr:MAG: hypothetical protein CO054_03230 [Candidatus Shapirobacteria bacterium CG_4_9_14_0_2_um_filter_39_11]